MTDNLVMQMYLFSVNKILSSYPISVADLFLFPEQLFLIAFLMSSAANGDTVLLPGIIQKFVLCFPFPNFAAFMGSMKLESGLQLRRQHGDA